jgi:hypothetical protein
MKKVPPVLLVIYLLFVQHCVGIRQCLRRSRRSRGGGRLFRLVLPFSVINAVPLSAIAILSEAFLAFLAIMRLFSQQIRHKNMLLSHFSMIDETEDHPAPPCRIQMQISLHR